MAHLKVLRFRSDPMTWVTGSSNSPATSSSAIGSNLIQVVNLPWVNSRPRWDTSHRFLLRIPRASSHSPPELKVSPLHRTWQAKRMWGQQVCRWRCTQSSKSSTSNHRCITSNLIQLSNQHRQAILIRRLQCRQFSSSLLYMVLPPRRIRNLWAAIRVLQLDPRLLSSLLSDSTIQ